MDTPHDPSKTASVDHAKLVSPGENGNARYQLDAGSGGT
jgi:hypothetical protein